MQHSHPCSLGLTNGIFFTSRRSYGWVNCVNSILLVGLSLEVPFLVGDTPIIVENQLGCFYNNHEK